ncbi:hypothetical protein MNEG_14371 [Monoraphidium neglectum]|uniref:Uncharacterized protein n=1 Tax=Monoraphidium neglectum TaxID=145388 RepID=A0A0D2J0L9_9CHLO|nr:hypothetical protein MNEG_14371 [Monoraphidium neglectum]KIY93592.1 hypothetical protein MNEG_14371 [Monoraphidium neglectum]|eukprot:XP_013892612.1 hypothetical protein MNEG_14371 [Monoraphidium neglectum]
MGLEGIPRLVGAAAAPHGAAPLPLVAEAMAALDALSLGQREALARGGVVDAIVNVLRLPAGGELSAPSAAAKGGGAAGDAVAAAAAALALRAKAHACNLITVLAFDSSLKRALYHKHAVGPLMVLSEGVAEGTAEEAAVQSALRQMGLGYLAPAADEAA